MNDSLFGVRRSIFIAHGRAGSVTGISRFIIMRGIAKPIFPRPPYLVVANVVVLKIIYDKEICWRKAPDRAYPRTVGIGVIDLVNTPIVSAVPLKHSGVIALGTKVPAAFVLWRTGIGFTDNLFICSEV